MITTVVQAVVPIDYTAIILTVLGTIGAGGLVKLVQMYIQYKKDKKQASGADGIAFRDSLQDRVVDLEGKVDSLQERIEDMIKMYSERIIVLSTENARLYAELESAHKEIENLLTDLEETDTE